MDQKQYCPICEAEVRFYPRYPNYLCSSCAKSPQDENGRSLIFHNESLSGGFIAKYRDTGEHRDGQICYVNGVKCRAGEAKFGGIVIEKILE